MPTCRGPTAATLVALFVLNLTLTLAVILAVPAARAGEAAPRVTAVVELFSSQACSSCPPADLLLSAYAERPGTLALSWHVDYWNHLGWRDTFSRAAFSQRQRGYAQRMESGVFTPQVVVNGQAQAVGSDGAEVERLIHGARSMPLLPISVRREGETVRVLLSGTAAERAGAEGAVLALVRYARTVRVAIARGENTGRTVTYRNVVLGVEPVGRVEGGRLEARLSVPGARKLGAEKPGARKPGAEDEGRALVLQHVEDGAPGPVLAAIIIE